MMGPLTAGQKKRICEDPDFQRVFKSDSELDRLSGLLFDDEADTAELHLLLGGKLLVDACGRELILPAPPPALVAFLWSQKSPYIIGGVITGKDTAIALYALANGKKTQSGGASSLTLSQAVRFLDGLVLTPDAHRALSKELEEIFDASFRPYRRGLPCGEAVEAPAEPRYDAIWLSGLAARVCAVTGLAPDVVIWDMPMSNAALYDLQYRSLHNGEHLCRAYENADVQRMYWDRIYTLMEKFAEKTFGKDVEQNGGQNGSGS